MLQLTHPISQLVLVLVSLLCTTGCASLPDLAKRHSSYAVMPEQTEHTQLGRFISGAFQIADEQRPRINAGVAVLDEAEASLITRLMLIQHAERSIDIQYYIWRDDTSGLLMLQALQQAADRGVRVRLLLDDIHSTAITPFLHQLNTSPNAEVRLVNPFMPRGALVWGFLTDFDRANRRMHNKSLTVDSQASIVGGRNIGNDYFLRGHTDILFSDMDLLAVGPIVRDISVRFDLYWNSDSAYPLELLEAAPATAPRLPTIDYLPQVPSLQEFFSHTQWYGVQAIVVTDSPSKLLGDAAPEELITHKFKIVLAEPQQEVLLVSPYFIPSEALIQSLTDLVHAGVSVHILTNAFATNDVALVHSGYAKHRKALLRAGVRLFELKPSAIANPLVNDDEGEELTFSSVSASSLHAKTFIIDRDRVFVGSFNFDPRSVHLNTELGLVVISDTLAARMAETFIANTPGQAYEVVLNEKNRLEWIERDRAGDVIRMHAIEPETSWFQRLAIGFFSFLPIDSLL